MRVMLGSFAQSGCDINEQRAYRRTPRALLETDTQGEQRTHGERHAVVGRGGDGEARDPGRAAEEADGRGCA
ncbi:MULTISPECIES: hypothetical protein [Anaeromyxobacter]|uniref:hypothetical protein n=1 Tax=Anaeromyxobacter TaxID=161492 RepID=UPI001F57120F|nr:MULTISPECIES: hypothetical protein [unclassified Anaeromyxobacter]